MAGLTDDGSRIVAGEVHIHRRSRTAAQLCVSDADFDDLHATAATGATIRGLNATRVALQLPDELLPAATRLYRRLRAHVGDDVLLYILGDTTFAACCADEVAAQHAHADLLLHYGPACLTAPTARMPVRHVLPRNPLDVPRCIGALAALRDCALAAGRQGVVLMFDASFYRHMPSVWGAWCGVEAAEAAEGPEPTASATDSISLVHPPYHPPTRTHQSVVLATLEAPPSGPDGVVRHSRHGLQFLLPGDHAATDYATFFVADPESPAMQPVLLQAKFAVSSSGSDMQDHLCVFAGDGESDSNAVSDMSAQLDRRLRRRFFMIEKVISALTCARKEARTREDGGGFFGWRLGVSALLARSAGQRVPARCKV